MNQESITRARSNIPRFPWRSFSPRYGAGKSTKADPAFTVTDVSIVRFKLELSHSLR
jgi:hypothetical protein